MIVANPSILKQFYYPSENDREWMGCIKTEISKVATFL